MARPLEGLVAKHHLICEEVCAHHVMTAVHDEA
jgi:hypothetical protein